MSDAERFATHEHRRAGKIVASVRRVRLTSQIGAYEAQRHELAATTIRVGSHPANDLALDDPAVSRIHFEIIADAHGFRLRDLGSTNGTFVDGWRVNDVYLRPGARIELGDSHITFDARRGRHRSLETRRGRGTDSHPLRAGARVVPAAALRAD